MMRQTSTSVVEMANKSKRGGSFQNQCRLKQAQTSSLECRKRINDEASRSVLQYRKNPNEAARFKMNADPSKHKRRCWNVDDEAIKQDGRRCSERGQE
mmetsp:Transcript_15461/g.25268  ORF Transcript_15461/g.25268 Transcript_15461/m.25268 type:complete len:98 (-) Transcript_15461:83-376(-)